MNDTKCMRYMHVCMQDRKALEGTDSVLKHVIAALEEEGIDTTSDENGWYGAPKTVFRSKSFPKSSVFFGSVNRSPSEIMGSSNALQFCSRY